VSSLFQDRRAQSISALSVAASALTGAAFGDQGLLRMSCHFLSNFNLLLRRNVVQIADLSSTAMDGVSLPKSAPGSQVWRAIFAEVPRRLPMVGDSSPPGPSEKIAGRQLLRPITGRRQNRFLLATLP
jgi:hypothetical protein